MAGGKENRPVFATLGGELPGKLFGVLPTPCYIIDEAGLQKNCEMLAGVIKRTGCKILLAQKAFSNYDFYPLLAGYLTGTEASGLYEARLGAEEMPGKEVHVFCAAYSEREFDELLNYADHIVFNSPAQLARFGPKAKRYKKSIGLRINPQFSTQSDHAIYDPCAPGSRLGTTRAMWDEQMTAELIGMLDGLHFHTLCEQDSDDLEKTYEAVEAQFSDVLGRMKWLNMGGGHHITKEGYDILRLEKVLTDARTKWDVEVYLEPGEAVALNAGYLATQVLDVVKNGDISIAILDASAACHMPDVIEMPYKPPLYDADSECRKSFIYRLAGPTCLAGDVIGDYGFDEEVQTGDLLLFGDMAIYTTCKNNTFNGMALPDIWKRTAEGSLVRLTDFGYVDFKKRLGTARS